jgi:hypothetical protein
MKNLRTVEEVFRQDGERFVCAIAALPAWKHYDPDNCPAPIREWIQQRYPDVVIEQLSGDYESAAKWNSDDIDPSAGLHWPTPIFRLGFNAQQAEHFEQVWRTLPPGSPGMPKDFYFLIHELHDPCLSTGAPDVDAPLIQPMDHAPRDKVTE